MAQHRSASVGTTTARPDEGAPNGSSADLSTAVDRLTQATQALTALAAQMMQTMHPGALTGSPQAQSATRINTWEDDPFSEAAPSVNPQLAMPLAVASPVNANPLLQTQIVDPRPPAGQFPSGTANFRYWMVTEALARGINFWTPLLPAQTRWSTVNPMSVRLDAGEDLNAFYSREDGGLFFFHKNVRNRTFFSADSPDVVCHELGHAILDALKPQLFDAASSEVAAFHEAFGDMSSILCALQLPSERDKVLKETQGHLNVNSRLSRIAEQLGWAIRQLAPTAVDLDCLRNACNRFFYRRPSQLPPQAPASALSSEVHSFSRVFTGAFLDTLAGMVQTLGPVSDANLLKASQDLGQLLVDGVHTASVTPDFYSQVAAAMIQADQARYQGRYGLVINLAFRQRGILSLAAETSLADAPVPEAVPEASAISGSPVAGVFSGIASATQTRLTYNDQDDDGYRTGPENAPSLPTQLITTDMGISMHVHAATQPARFSVVPAALLGAPTEPVTADEAARHFLEDLIQLERLDLGALRTKFSSHLKVSMGGLSQQRKTHTVRDTPEGPVLKRLHFDCTFCNRR